MENRFHIVSFFLDTNPNKPLAMQVDPGSASSLR